MRKTVATLIATATFTLAGAPALAASTYTPGPPMPVDPVPADCTDWADWWNWRLDEEVDTRHEALDYLLQHTQEQEAIIRSQSKRLFRQHNTVVRLRTELRMLRRQHGH